MPTVPAPDEPTLISRRGVLVGSLGALGACTGAGAAGYHDLPDGGFPDTGSPVGTYDAGAVDAADVVVLNTLLMAEYGAIAAYNAAVRALGAPGAGDPLASQAGVLAAAAMHWSQHHQAHASALVGAVVTVRGTPASASAAGFRAPQGYTPTVGNVLKLLSNTEKALAVAYATAVAGLSRADQRFLVNSVCGDEAQHHAVLDVLLRHVLSLSSAVAMGGMDVVPAGFVSDYGSGYPGLQSVTDLSYG